MRSLRGSHGGGKERTATPFPQSNFPGNERASERKRHNARTLSQVARVASNAAALGHQESCFLKLLARRHYGGEEKPCGEVRVQGHSGEPSGNRAPLPQAAPNLRAAYFALLRRPHCAMSTSSEPPPLGAGAVALVTGPPIWTVPLLWSCVRDCSLLLALSLAVWRHALSGAGEGFLHLIAIPSFFSLPSYVLVLLPPTLTLRLIASMLRCTETRVHY